MLNGVSFRDQSGQATDSNLLYQFIAILHHTAHKLLETRTFTQGLVQSLPAQILNVRLELICVNSFNCVFANVLLNIGSIFGIVELGLEECFV